jgi:uncharacterized protein (TIRG00374 family)
MRPADLSGGRAPATDALGVEATAADPLASAAPSRSWRRLAVVLAKTAVTVTLGAWLIADIDWAEFRRTIGASEVWLLVAVVLLRFVGVWLSALKWSELLKVHHVRYRLHDLFGWYLVGVSISQFLPSLIGGDSYRIYKTYRNSRARVVALLAVLADRVTGAIALLAAAYAAAIWLYFRDHDALAAGVIVLGTAAAVGAATALLVLEKSGYVHRFAASKYCPKPLASLIAHSRDYLKPTAPMRVAWLYALAFHGSRVLCVWLILVAFGWHTDPLELTLAVTAVTIAGMLPISIGGLGVMEASFAYAIAYYGVPLAVGVATMLVMRIQTLALCAAAAVYFVLDRRHDRPLGHAA